MLQTISVQILVNFEQRKSHQIELQSLGWFWNFGKRISSGPTCQWHQPPNRARGLPHPYLLPGLSFSRKPSPQTLPSLATVHCLILISCPALASPRSHLHRRRLLLKQSRRSTAMPLPTHASAPLHLVALSAGRTPQPRVDGAAEPNPAPFTPSLQGRLYAGRLPSIPSRVLCSMPSKGTDSLSSQQQ
jgi:hypothetical protein